MKQLNKLPPNVDKPCGTLPGPDDERYVLSGDLSRCMNPASYSVTVDGREVLLCGSHRKSIQDSTQRIFPEVLDPTQEAGP